MGKTRARSDAKSHAERKFEKKVQFYDRVRSVVESKSISKEKKQKKRSRQKKLKAYDLSSLSECLSELKATPSSKPAELKLNCKRRNSLVLKESSKLRMIINDPNYQSDPLAAIHQHLQMTQPVEEKPKRKDGKTKKTKTKMKKSKATVSMDI